MRYLYWCIIYWLIIVVAYLITFRRFGKFKKKIANKIGVELVYKSNGFEITTVNEYGLKFIIMGFYAIILVLPFINYYPKSWPVLLGGITLIYIGTMILYRRNIYNSDITDKMMIILNNKENILIKNIIKRDYNSDIFSYMTILLYSVMGPLAIIIFISYFLTFDIGGQLTIYRFLILVLPEFIVLNIFIYVDKLNDLLFKVFHRDFTRGNYMIFYDILRFVLPVLPYILLFVCKCL